MYTNCIQLRIRYSETDQMGYVYYGNYAQFYEVGRTELMRNIGLSYREIEEQHIMLPVFELHSKFIRPACYDDVIDVHTSLHEYPGVRIRFTYEIFNQKKELLNTGETTLIFINSKTRRPIKAPERFLEIMRAGIKF